jgi:hypothetical protein
VSLSPQRESLVGRALAGELLRRCRLDARSGGRPGSEGQPVNEGVTGVGPGEGPGVGPGPGDAV